MIVTITVLILFSLSLFLNNPNVKNNGLKYFQLIFCISISFLLPTIVHRVAFDLTKYDNQSYWLFIMYPCTIVVASGLQMMIFGKFRNMDV